MNIQRTQIGYLVIGGLRKNLRARLVRVNAGYVIQFGFICNKIIQFLDQTNAAHASVKTRYVKV